MPVWNPEQYLKFGAERLRPALDLMGRVPLEDPGFVCDLGCGTGNVTRLLAERWPAARVCGVDSSPDMLAKARSEGGGAIDWIEADLADWRPDAPPDLLYSNAALQWLPDHAALFPRLVGRLAPSGVLAVQMPRNHAAPAQALIGEMAADARWAAQLAGVFREAPVSPPEAYYGWLKPCAARVEVWETIYWQALAGDNPVVEFTRATRLKPVLDALEGDSRETFLAEYAARVRAAYPPRPDGTTLYPFRRLFLIAVRED